MTQEVFNNTRFGAGMQVMYKEKIYDIVTVDFGEALIGIVEAEGSEEGDVDWKRCENCELV